MAVRDQVRINGLTQNHTGNRARLSLGKFAGFKKMPLRRSAATKRRTLRRCEDIHDEIADKIEEQKMADLLEHGVAYNREIRASKKSFTKLKRMLLKT